MKALFLLLGFFFGIQLGFQLSVYDYLGVGCHLVFSFLCLLLSLKKKQVLFFALPFLVGFFLMFFSLPLEESNEYRGMVVKTSENYYVLFVNFRRYYIYEKGNTKELGDIVKILGSAKNFASTTYESRFNFGDYLASLGIRYELSVKQESVLFENPLRLKAIENAFLDGLSGNAKALTAALLFARQDQSNELISLASSLNLVFAISSSGLLYGLALREVEKRLKWKTSDQKAETITFILSIVLLIFGFRKVGIRRIFLTRLLRLIAHCLGIEKPDACFLTSASGFFLLVLNRYEALQSGFMLGYGISLLFYFTSRDFKRVDFFLRFFARYALLRLAILPLSFANGEIHLLGGIYSLLLLPVSSIYGIIGYSVFCIPYLKLVLNPLSEGVFYLLKGFSHLDPIIPVPPPSILFYFLYYGIFLFVLLLLELGIKKNALIVTATSILLYIVSTLPLPTYLSDQVSFINVGQGDSILIRDNTYSVLIDTGGNQKFDMAKEVLIPFFRKERIDHIDYLITSHSDFDHAGAKDSLMANFPVYHYLENHDDFPLKIGGLTFYSYNIYESKDENEKSLVLGLDFMDKKWIFTGDADIKIEKQILADNPNLDCDILKLGHHGSDTSSCAEWLDALTPETAIVSCGKNNSYGHPSPSVIAQLKARGMTIRRTDEEGTITYRRFSFSSV